MNRIHTLVKGSSRRVLICVLVMVLGMLSLFGTQTVMPVQAQASELFISEYVEGSSLNKAIEIYNGTGATVDLTNYTLELYFNGNSSLGNTINLTGTVAFGDVHVVAHSTANAAILAVADQTTSSLSFNGDDAVVLKANGSVIDVIGEVGVDPGTEWGTGDTSTQDNTIRRNADVCAGDTVADDAFDPSVEWTGFPQNNIDDLGQHLPTCAGDVPPVVTSTVPANGAGNVSPATTITVNFSEPVTASTGWYSISCSVSGAVTATESGGSSSYTLTPDAPLPAGETCTVDIIAANVVDQDGTADAMLSDYSFSFSVPQPLSCDADLTPIFTIQGSGSSAAITGEVDTVGVVVADYQEGGYDGFFIQDETGDANPATSDGIFVYDPNTLLDVVVGQKVAVRGNAGEFSGLTQISASGSNGVIMDCGAGTITPTVVTMPVPSLATWEAMEGMLVQVQGASGDLTVTENFNLGRFNEVVISSGGRLWQYTQISQPTDAAANNAYLDQLALRRLFIDDGRTNQNPDPVIYPQPELTAGNTLRSGYTMTSVTGALGYSFGEYRIQPVMSQYPITFTASNPRPETSPEVGGTLKVASFNVLNYFNGPAFPDGRGADTAEEFTRQNAKIVSALVDIDADVVGLMEIENEAETPDAVATLVDSLNAVMGPNTYAYINTGVLGTDEIRVALIYKPASVTPVGQFAILDSSVDPNFLDTKNRPSLAQTFADAQGARFTVVVNHLKSKGSDCNDVGDPDTGDGQGNCNLTRTAAAIALANWLATDPTSSGDRDFLIIGDLNSYAMEDPIMALKAAGFVDLADAFNTDPYSYVFFGQWGTLDYAMANGSLASQVIDAQEWHINADEPSVLDYNTDFESPEQAAKLYAPDEFRSSDHDPIIVGLDLMDEVELVSPTGTITDPYGDPLYVWNHVSIATSYQLYVDRGSANTRVLFEQNLDPALYCDATTCQIDPTELTEAYRLNNGDHRVWIGVNRAVGNPVWFGSFTFTLAAEPPMVATLGTTTETDTFTPVLHWTLDGTAIYTSWFRVFVLPTDRAGGPMVDQWIRRSEACGDVDGTDCAFEVRLQRNNTEYQFWLRGYGPGGFAIGGIPENPSWTGPETFTIAVPLPNTPQNIVVDPRQGRPLVSWDADPNAQWYQLWLGHNPNGSNVNKWFNAADICDATTCTVDPNINWRHNPSDDFMVWMRAWGPGGFSGWTQGPDWNLPADAPAAPTGLNATGLDTSNPTFMWNGTANATWYRFEIEPTDPANGTWTYGTWHLSYTLDDPAGSGSCGDATGNCVWQDPALDGKLTPGVGYTIRVRAWGPGGMGDYSDDVSVTYTGPTP